MTETTEIEVKFFQTLCCPKCGLVTRFEPPSQSMAGKGLNSKESAQVITSSPSATHSQPTSELMKQISAIPNCHAKARDKFRAVIHLWKRDWTPKEICEKHKITLTELERWSRMALHGAVNNLRQDGLRKAISQ